MADETGRLLLDRPVWHALAGPHARFAHMHGMARRFIPDIGPLAAPRDYDEAGLAALAALVPADAALFTMEAVSHPAPPRVAMERREGVQMIAEAPAKARSRALPDRETLLPLGTAEAADMLALARLTEPGPFGMRTGELGRFWGVKREGRLIAMAGERLRLPGFSEVSGVCTHPDFRGHGFARALMLKVMAQIRDRNETPFLTSYAHNAGAIALYESIGFRVRREMTISVLTREEG